ncbi:MAG: hypothetical protein GWN84_21130, partial [Gammaproteobacteria bacterium]|nr:hypothetical protein [Gammaproteobacteria bacterium]NIR85246.1 hypothetical protein [Gammaproteobacteria bacterium]NIR88349.1 hypothetical protein [Gammaproteobacteria bacterium]NIU06311.1 hypothetical protein [Gammaproteobacteria bacterium]NIX87584.1 hypothetical protein [Gammaproteobacteria bacterium]
MDTASRADASAADPEAWRYFEPDDYLLGIVQRAVAKEQAVAVGLKGLGEMRILPTRSEYFIDFAPERMLKFCNRPAGEYEVRRLGKLEVDELAAREQPGRNLDEVMWQAAQAASQGKLVKGCRR